MPALPSRQPTIARIWRGRTPRGRAEAYEAYHREAGIAPLIAKALGVQVVRGDRGDQAEFITTSDGASLENLVAFNGRDPTLVHHLEGDPEFLSELPGEVRVLRLLDSHGLAVGGPDHRGL